MHRHPSPAPALGLLTASELEHATERRHDDAQRRAIDAAGGVDAWVALPADTRAERTLDAAGFAWSPPRCGMCDGDGVLGHRQCRTCQGRGELLEAECEGCTRWFSLGPQADDASPHFCADQPPLGVNPRTCEWYLCAACRRDSGCHSIGCAS